ncbi:MAG: diguanylate cyclase, partial [Actinobacteria bacterium]|nr:diguanylate cyclase [Actinomycetota bacterium]
MAEKRPISGINEIDIYSDLNDSDINAISALQKVLDSFPDYVLLIDEHHHIVMANDKICINTGKEPKNLTGKYCPQIIHGMNSPFPGCPLEDSLKQGCSVEKEIFDPAYKKWFLSCIYTTELRTKKNLRIYLHIIKDITEKKISQERIKYLSFHDKLTGLYNRAFFEEELIRLDVKRQLPLSLVIGDVNGLKLINDAFGHEKGDELLKKISKILKDCFRAEDIIARWGGD